MTYAADLGAMICTGELPVPGVIHDPSQPLVLGNQSSNNYCVITWDAVAHRAQIQSVYQPAGGSLQQAIYTFDTLGNLLINGVTIAQLPELQALVTAAQAAATQSVAAQAASETAAAQSATSASTSAAAANTATDQASLSQQFAQAPEGTALPGGGKSSFAYSDDAEEIAVESRDLDVSDPVSGDETFQSGFLFTEQVRNPTALMKVTIPPGIYSSGEKKKRWASYRLKGAGSIQFIPQPGGTNLVTPTVMRRGRTMWKWNNAGAATHLISIIAAIPAITNGEIIAVYQGSHNVASGNVLGMTFTTSGGAALTWTPLQALPTNPRGQHLPDFYVTRAPLVGFAAADVTLNFQEGTNVEVQMVDYWVLEGTSGATPLFGMNTIYASQSHSDCTIPAVPAQSKILYVSSQYGALPGAAFSSFSANLSSVQTGNTAGIDEVAVGDTNANKNAAFAIAEGVATGAGDLALTTNWSGAQKQGCFGIAYHPKSVVGGGVVVLNLQGTPGRDTITEANGVAELWFENDGKTVDVRIPKP